MMSITSYEVSKIHLVRLCQQTAYAIGLCSSGVVHFQLGYHHNADIRHLLLLTPWLQTWWQVIHVSPVWLSRFRALSDLIYSVSACILSSYQCTLPPTIANFRHKLPSVGASWIRSNDSIWCTAISQSRPLGRMTRRRIAPQTIESDSCQSIFIIHSCRIHLCVVTAA